MKVLLVNWSWYPTGGDWTYINNLRTLYEQHGWEVVSLSTVHEKNVAVDSSAYFIPSPDYKSLNEHKNILNGIKAFSNSIVSFNALHEVGHILENHKIDVAHLHNIHHYITPAIIWKLKSAGVRIVWSLHDYKIICPERTFYSNGKICEKCLAGDFHKCLQNKCKKDSVKASLLAIMDAYFYHLSGIYDKVDAFLCPSLFLKNKFVEFGFDEKKLQVTNLCYDIPVIDDFISANEDPGGRPGRTFEGDYILYVGSILDIKGIRTLIGAVKNTGIVLKIVGSGPAENELQELVQRENLTNIEFLGFRDKNSVFELTLHSKFVVCPSEWYENFPFSVIESFLFSKPVVGSKIGGIPEMVIDGETGSLFEAGNVDDLREKLVTLWNNDVLVKLMGLKARKYICDIVNFDTHWWKLDSIINNMTSNGN